MTVLLLTDVFLDYSSRIAEHPKVDLVTDDGRTFLARTDDRYDLIFFVAPDSYTAMNSASSAAFVLSESYLYTQEMIAESLEHLSDGGFLGIHFGEFDFQAKPNRTTRYLATARAAFRTLGVTDFRRHVLVSTSPSFVPLATILLKKLPLTDSERERFVAVGNRIRGTIPRYVDSSSTNDPRLAAIVELPDEEQARWLEAHPYAVGAVTDDAPFFWHFARFAQVLRGVGQEAKAFDNEDTIGERSLLAMLATAAVFAGGFLLLPFVVIRKTWAGLPRKLPALSYFAALGMGFMLYETALMQKLVLYLGYPTYSLSVTLMSLLVSAGVGSMLSGAYVERGAGTIAALLAGLFAVTLLFLFASPALFEATLAWPIVTRAGLTLLLIAPLGLLLGAFMPLGLAAVARLTPHRNEYIAWGWAVNGFFSVVGSVGTTMLSMSFGFTNVVMLGFLLYSVAGGALVALRKA